MNPLVFLLCALLAQPAAAPPSAPHASEPRPGVQHFGFSIVDAGHDDPNDAVVQTNYADEVGGFCTFADLAAFAPDEDISARLDHFNTLGLGVFLNLQFIVFDSVVDATVPSGFRVSLRADAADRLAAFVELNALTDRQDELVALYLVDEPVWNGLSAADLEAAAVIVNSALPQPPITIIEAYPAIDQLVIPEQIDWVGFDRYAVGDPSTDKGWQNDLATLIARRSREDQGIIIVMETQWLPAYGELGFTAEMMGIVALNYAKAARDCPEAIAIIGYTWPGGFEDPQQLGARNLPEPVLRIYRSIGAQIIRRAPNRRADD